VAVMANELRQLVDTANAPIFGIDVKGNVNEWNLKTAEITGFQKDEAFGKHLVSTFIVPKLRESVKEILDNAVIVGGGRHGLNKETSFGKHEIFFDELMHILYFYP
jgi:PAS domain S-box-containing protein